MKSLVSEAGEITRRDVVACRHCSLPVPSGAKHTEFCCTGCATVFELIHDGRLEKFYDLGGGRGHPVGASGRADSREWLREAQRVELGAGLSCELEVDVQGLHCAACVWLLQELWGRLPGAIDIRVNPSIGRMRLRYDSESLNLDAYFDACEALGYRIGPVGKSEPSAERALLVRLGVCVALAINAMVFALAEYFGMTRADGEVFFLFRGLSALLATIAVAVGGPVFFRAALAGARRKVLHLDLPIALGITLSYGASLLAFVVGSNGAVYFDTVTVFVALMVLGRFIQGRAVRRNRDFLLAASGIEHMKVRRLSDGVIERIPVGQIRPGETLVIVPGDLVPVRARVRDEAAAFSLDWINGESEPRRFESGEEVPAGAFSSGRSGVVVVATATAADSGLQALLATPLERDEGARSSVFWSTLNRGYVAAVLAIAAIAGGAWACIDPSRVVGVVTAVLVVTCPCALGIATPLAFDLALARLRRRGVFVRRAALLDKARFVQRIVFDKTGTLTWGGVQIVPRQVCPDAERDVLYTMAMSSNHPVSRAIAESLGDRLAQQADQHGARFIRDLVVQDVPGRGLIALARGAEYRLGSTTFALPEAGDSGRNGECVLSRDGRVVACFDVEEDYRAGAELELSELIEAGLRIEIASGDRPDRVARAARHLGLPPQLARGGLSPEDKARLIRETGPDSTMMVGDGLNDALAFDAAACSGTPALDRPAMPGRADFFYVGAGVGAVSAVLRTAQRLHAVVRANLWLAGAYNAIAVTLSVVGLMAPWLVAILMPASSLVLIASTTRGMSVGDFGDKHS